MVTESTLDDQWQLLFARQKSVCVGGGGVATPQQTYEYNSPD